MAKMRSAADIERGLRAKEREVCAKDLLQRLPLEHYEKNLSDIIDLAPNVREKLLSCVEQPLKIGRDKIANKDYILSAFNRAGESYRSPWSNIYDPPVAAVMPSEHLRKLEIDANEAFNYYREMYFEGGVSSVYLWHLDDGFRQQHSPLEEGFEAAILIKKTEDGSKAIKGCWDSVHYVIVHEKVTKRSAHYNITSAVRMWFETDKADSGTMNLSGHLVRQMSEWRSLIKSNTHVSNLGTLVETMENRLTSIFNKIYFAKTKSVVKELRSVQSLSDEEQQEELRRNLAAVAIENRKAKCKK